MIDCSICGAKNPRTLHAVGGRFLCAACYWVIHRKGRR